MGGNDIAKHGQRLVIGPWIHFPWVQKVGDIEFGAEARNPIDPLQLRWFDHWLKSVDNGVDREKPVRIFVMGANKWREADDWPSPETVFTDYYLDSLGQANTRYGNGLLSLTKPARPTKRSLSLRPGQSGAQHWRAFLLYTGHCTGRAL